MVKLETDIGTFEAEDTKQALAMERKAKREKAKRDKLESINHRMAGLKACENAYYLYDRKANKQLGPPGWRVVYPSLFAKPVIHEGTGDKVVYETDIDYVEFYHVGYRVVAILENGAGFPIGVWLQDIKEPFGLDFCAIGFHENVIRMLGMTGIDVKDYNEYRKE